MPKENRQDRRSNILRTLEDKLEVPMAVLAFVWLGILIVDLAGRLTPALQRLALFIWAVFIADFVVRLVLAPSKWAYVRANWLSALALLAPGLRILRAARVARSLGLAGRAARGSYLVRVAGSVNRGMRALGSAFKRRGFGYVVALTVIVTLSGAAGMLALERNPDDPAALNSYGAALWWTAMVMTTMGSEYWPRTPEGRILCVLLALYAFGVFGYVTATLASFFIGHDAADERGSLAGQKSIHELRAEIAALREEIRQLRQPK